VAKWHGIGTSGLGKVSISYTQHSGRSKFCKTELSYDGKVPIVAIHLLKMNDGLLMNSGRWMI